MVDLMRLPREQQCKVAAVGGYLPALADALYQGLRLMMSLSRRMRQATEAHDQGRALRSGHVEHAGDMPRPCKGCMQRRRLDGLIGLDGQDGR